MAGLWAPRDWLRDIDSEDFQQSADQIIGTVMPAIDAAKSQATAAIQSTAQAGAQAYQQAATSLPKFTIPSISSLTAGWGDSTSQPSTATDQLDTTSTGVEAPTTSSQPAASPLSRFTIPNLTSLLSGWEAPKPPETVEFTPSAAEGPAPSGAATVSAPGMPTATPNGQPTAPVALPDRLDTSSRDANLRQWAPALQDTERRTGLRADALAAIIQAENGGGQSPLSAKDNNYFSISYVPGRPNQAGPGTGGRFAAYATPQDSLNDFVDLIQKHYPEAWANRSDPQKFFQGLVKGGYIVPEPGFPVETWLQNLDTGRQHFNQIAPTPAPTAPSNIPGPDLSPNGTPITAPTQATGRGLDVNGIVQRYQGVPYTFGGPGGRGQGLGAPTDCSGFVSAVYQDQYGLSLVPHTDGAYNQLRQAGAAEVATKDARPGDVVFYLGAGTGGAITHHMGIYAGNGKVLDDSVSGQDGVHVRDVGHAGQYVILRDPRLNQQAPQTASVPPPIQPSGVAEATGGEKVSNRELQAQAQADQPTMYRQPLGMPTLRAPTGETSSPDDGGPVLPGARIGVDYPSQRTSPYQPALGSEGEDITINQLPGGTGNGQPPPRPYRPGPYDDTLQVGAEDMYRQPLGMPTAGPDTTDVGSPTGPPVRDDYATAGSSVPAAVPSAQAIPQEDPTAIPRPAYVPPAMPLVTAPDPTIPNNTQQNPTISDAGPARFNPLAGQTQPPQPGELPPRNAPPPSAPLLSQPAPTPASSTAPYNPLANQPPAQPGELPARPGLVEPTPVTEVGAVGAATRGNAPPPAVPDVVQAVNRGETVNPFHWANQVSDAAADQVVQSVGIDPESAQGIASKFVVSAVVNPINWEGGAFSATAEAAARAGLPFLRAALPAIAERFGAETAGRVSTWLASQGSELAANVAGQAAAGAVTNPEAPGFGAAFGGGTAAVLGPAGRAIGRGAGAVGSELRAGAERAATVEAERAGQRAAVAPGVFGVAPPEAGPAAEAVARPRFVPPDVRASLGTPREIPDDPRFQQAVENVGGQITDRGIELHVTRAQGETAAGQTATRGGVFVEPVRPGGRSSYVTSSDNPNAVGGAVVLPPTKTLYRKPLVLEEAPGAHLGFDQAMERLYDSRAAQAELDAAQVAWEDARVKYPSKHLPNGFMQPTPEETAAWNRLQAAQQGVPTSRTIDEGIRAARAAGPEGSPARAAALKDLVSRYGGDPSLIDPLLRIRGADASESAWAIKENIVASNARRQGYDGVFTMEDTGEPNWKAINQHPLVMKADQDFKAANAALSEADAAHQTAPTAANWRAYQQAEQAAQAAADAYKVAQQEAERLVGTAKLTEILDVQQGRNPTPGTPNPRIEEAQQRYEAAVAEADRLNAALKESVGQPAEVRKSLYQETLRARAAVPVAWDQFAHARNYEPAYSGPPGYSLHPDVAARADAQKTARQLYDDYQAAREAWRTSPNEAAGNAAEAEMQRLSRLMQEKVRAGDTSLTGVSASGDSTTAAGTAGITPVPVRQHTDVLASVNRALGQGVASAVSGGVGAATNQQLNPDDPNAAIKGFAVGAVAPFAISRGARALASRAGREAGPVEGALGVFGVGGRPKAQAVTNAADPTIRRVGQMMEGDYQIKTPPDPRTTAQRLGDAFAVAWTDNRAGLYRLQNSVSEALGRKLQPDEMVAELSRLNPASTASQRLSENLRPALQQVGEDQDWLSQYLVHSHNVDVAREMGQRAYETAITAGKAPAEASRLAVIAADTRQFSGDLNLAQTQKALTDIEATVKGFPDGTQRWQAIQDGAQAVWGHNRETLQRKLDAGLISQDLFNDLTQKYPRYVRTDIADYFERGSGAAKPAGRTIGTSDVGIQKLDPKGTGKDRVNPLLSTIDQTYTAESAIQRNVAGKAFEQLVDADPTWANTFREVVPQRGPNVGNPQTTVPGAYRLRGNEQFLTVWDKGDSRTFVIPGEFASLVSPQGGRVLGDSALANGWRSMMGIYKGLITSRNPAFSLVVSPIRDAGDYAIREAVASARHQGPLGAVEAVGALPGVIKDYVAAVPAAFSGILQGQFRGDLAAMMRAGAGQMSRPGHTDKELRRALGELSSAGGIQVRDLGDLRRLVGNVVTLGAGPVGERLEQVPRLAAARRAATRGASTTEQAMAFRDATVDFQRGGDLAKSINAAVPFFNTSIQGGAQVARTARQNPAAFLSSVAATIGLATAGAEAWNNSDPQRAQDYQDVPDYLKKTGIIFMLPGVTGTDQRGDRRPNFAWVPTGNYGALVGAARDAIQKSGQEQGGADLSTLSGWGSLAADVAGTFSPLRGDSAGSALTSLIPPPLSTAADLVGNKDLYRGTTIATDRADQNASALAAGSASAFNRATGQETRPSQWDYLYRDLGGFAAGAAGEASNMLAEEAGLRPRQQEQRPIQDFPVAGGMVGRVIRDSVGRGLQTAQDERNRVPESIRPILQEAGLRREQVAPVPSTLQNIPLTRAEQADWQDRTNGYIEREVDQASRSAAYRARGADQQKIIQDAIAAARSRAANEVFRQIPPAERSQRLRDAQAQKAS